MDKRHHDTSWYATHTALHAKDEFMLPPREWVDFIKLLKPGKAYDGNGKRVDTARLTNILNEIWEIRSPWRVEHLDAYFEDKNGVLYINSKHRTVNGELKPQYTAPLEECLMEGRVPGIDLDYWLNNATKQGMPPSNIPEGELYYMHPRATYVARFGAGSGGASLDCNWVPVVSGPALGVRVVRERESAEGVRISAPSLEQVLGIAKQHLEPEALEAYRKDLKELYGHKQK